MMNQFQVIDGYLTVTDTSWYDPSWGFYRVLTVRLKELT